MVSPHLILSPYPSLGACPQTPSDGRNCVLPDAAAAVFQFARLVNLWYSFK